MLKVDAITFFGSKTKLANAAGVRLASVAAWGIRTFRGSSGLVTGNMYRKKRIVTTGRTIKFRPYSLPHQSQLHQKNWLKLCTFMNN